MSIVPAARLSHFESLQHLIQLKLKIETMKDLKRDDVVADYNRLSLMVQSLLKQTIEHISYQNINFQKAERLIQLKEPPKDPIEKIDSEIEKTQRIFYLALSYLIDQFTKSHYGKKDLLRLQTQIKQNKSNQKIIESYEKLPSQLQIMIARFMYDRYTFEISFEDSEALLTWMQSIFQKLPKDPNDTSLSDPSSPFRYVIEQILQVYIPKH